MLQVLQDVEMLQDMVFEDSPRKVPEAEQYERWIVVTTINGPTPSVEALSQIPGWKMVVVGDRKTPAAWRW